MEKFTSRVPEHCLVVVGEPESEQVEDASRVRNQPG